LAVKNTEIQQIKKYKNMKKNAKMQKDTKYETFQTAVLPPPPKDPIERNDHKLLYIKRKEKQKKIYNEKVN